MVSIGTLLAFVLVCTGVLILRKTQPQVPRTFKAPCVPVVPLLGILTCLVMMLSLPAETWLRLLVWLGLGLLIYFSYGKKHSKLRQAAEASASHGSSEKQE